jgi:glycine/D-amino acid oxidase-like deaminating enzyme
LLKASIAAPLAAMSHRARAQGPRILVVGAGAFGGWTALELVRRGARVTLVDAWGPGNARASSGGETRVIRASYGSRAIYTRMAARALELWRAYDERHRRGLFRKTGGLWMFGPDDSFGRASLVALRAAGLRLDELTRTEASRTFPQIDFEGITTILFEPEAGYVLARRACEHVAEQVVAEGGSYREAFLAPPVRLAGERLAQVTLSTGESLEADRFVFACGPWLGALFPEVLASVVVPTRQEVYYFGPPAGDRRFAEGALPVWVEVGDRLVYGIPANVNRGFKIADDTAGPRFEPTDGNRDTTRAGVDAARAFIARRFPALAVAPFLGGEVCQYESSPDSHFILDRHPAASNVWLVGGGSGHGFKMGPAMGEMVAAAVLGTSDPDATFALARFTRTPPDGAWPEKWS